MKEQVPQSVPTTGEGPTVLPDEQRPAQSETPPAQQPTSTRKYPVFGYE